MIREIDILTDLKQNTRVDTLEEIHIKMVIHNHGNKDQEETRIRC